MSAEDHSDLIAKLKEAYGESEYGLTTIDEDDLAEAITALGEAGEAYEIGLADGWDEAMKSAIAIVIRRSGTYEASIDLMVEPNPYRHNV